MKSGTVKWMALIITALIISVVGLVVTTVMVYMIFSLPHGASEIHASRRL